MSKDVDDTPFTPDRSLSGLRISKDKNGELIEFYYDIGDIDPPEMGEKISLDHLERREGSEMASTRGATQYKVVDRVFKYVKIEDHTEEAEIVRLLGLIVDVSVEQVSESQTE